MPLGILKERDTILVKACHIQHRSNNRMSKHAGYLVYYTTQRFRRSVLLKPYPLKQTDQSHQNVHLQHFEGQHVQYTMITNECLYRFLKTSEYNRFLWVRFPCNKQINNIIQGIGWKPAQLLVSPRANHLSLLGRYSVQTSCMQNMETPLFNEEWAIFCLVCDVPGMKIGFWEQGGWVPRWYAIKHM